MSDAKNRCEADDICRYDPQCPFEFQCAELRVPVEDLTVELTINHMTVLPCNCKTKTRHWSMGDILSTLGRAPTDADEISLTAYREER